MISPDDMIDADAQDELAVLAGVMAVPEAYDKVAAFGLTPASFSHPGLGSVWLAIENLAVACKPIDPASVYQALRARGEDGVSLSYLTRMVPDGWGHRSIAAHAERVKCREIEREMLRAAGQIREIAQDPSMQLADKLDRAQGLLAGLCTAAVRKVPRHIAEIAVERIDHWTALNDGRIEAGWPTAIPTLDNALNGGFKPGQLVILAARPSVGKSSLAGQLSITFAERGLTALFLSQEMPEEEVADRAASNAGRIDYGRIQSGKFQDDDWSRSCDAMEKLRDLPIFVDDQSALTLSDVRAKARLVPGLKVLVLDYLQLCPGDGDNRNAEVEKISRGLKALAKDMGILVIALSQLNRKVEERTDKRPILADLRDSGAIEQDADVILFLWPVREFSDHRVVGCHVAKNRQGQKPAFALAFQGAIQRWAESTADINPPPPPKVVRRAFDPNAD